MVSVMGVPLGRVLTVEMNRKGSAATVSGRFPRGYIWDIPVEYACVERVGPSPQRVSTARSNRW
jgi:hypothetical protein